MHVIANNIHAMDGVAQLNTFRFISQTGSKNYLINVHQSFFTVTIQVICYRLVMLCPAVKIE